MTGSRVSEVRLRLRVPSVLAGSAQSLRSTVERELVVRVLEELERLLHARFGSHRLIRIRRLSSGWRLKVGDLVDQSTIEKLAADLADQIADDVAALPAGERMRPRSERFAVFESAAHADAVYLADVADGEPARWIHADRPDASVVWDAIVAAELPHIEEVVTWLRSMRRLEPALALASPSTRASLSAAVPAISSTIALLRARETAAPNDAAPRIGAVAQAAPIAPVVASRSTAATRAPSILPPPVPDALEDTPALGHRDESPAAPAREHLDDAIAIASLASSDRPAIDEPSPPLDANVADTAFAGLFYLAGCTLEIDLAERLWAAGIPEGDALAAIAEAIVGASEDPGPRWFGGLFDRERHPLEIEAWAAAEIVETVQHALGRRLVRLGTTLSAGELERRLDALARDVPRSPATSSLVHRVIARSVAALATIVAARLGRPASLVELRDMCSRPARLVLLDNALHVIMPHTALDFDHRRAGLDRDPGHVPWLGRTLRIELVGGEVI